MKRLWPILTIGCALAISAGCNRPSKGDCKKAIENIRTIYDADPASDAEIAAAVRSCQGNATKKSVSCFIESRNLTELRACEGDMFKKMFGEEPPPAQPATPPAPVEPTPAPTPPAAATGDAGASSDDAAADEAAAGEKPAAPAAGEKPAAPAAGEKPAAPAAGDAPQ